MNKQEMIARVKVLAGTDNLDEGNKRNSKA